MNSLQIGIIGAGVIARTAHLNAFLAHPDKFQVVAICDRDPEAARQLGEALPRQGGKLYEDYRALLDDPAVSTVLVAVPPFIAASIAIDALRAGKHVVMEKPMGNTGDDARAVLDAARAAAGKFIVAEQFFFTPAFQKLMEMARKGDWPFGPPSLVELQQFWKMTPETIPQFYHSPWRHDKRLTWGYLIEGGCHVVNLLRELFGQPSGIRSRMYSVDSKLGKYDTLLANCLLGGSTPCQLTMTYGIEHPAGRTNTFLHALGGTIIANDWEKIVTVEADGTRQEIACPKTWGDNHEIVWTHFHEMVFEGVPARFAPEQSYGDIAFMQRLIDEAVIDVPGRGGEAD